jgi:hypothetical protein
MVEVRIADQHGKRRTEAEQAIDALERECLTLKAVLSEHPWAGKPAPNQSG